MKNNKRLILAFDVAVLILIFSFLSITVYALYFYKPKESPDKVLLTLKVPSENIKGLVRVDEMVYFNGVNKPVKIQSVVESEDKLLITLESNGAKKNNYYIFNGQRISVNQKSEIHAEYTVQGFVISIKNE